MRTNVGVWFVCGCTMEQWRPLRFSLVKGEENLYSSGFGEGTSSVGEGKIKVSL